MQIIVVPTAPFSLCMLKSHITYSTKIEEACLVEPRRQAVKTDLSGWMPASGQAVAGATAVLICFWKFPGGSEAASFSRTTTGIS